MIETILLFGGFMVNDNYGDVIQAKYWVDLYRKSGHKIIFICHLNGKAKCKSILKLSENEIVTTDEAKSIEFNLNSILHMYGGGYLNNMWADEFLPTMNCIYGQNIKIIATGVQVDGYFIEKSKNLPIEYISVRDAESSRLTGCELILDDSFAYFLSRKAFYDFSYFLSKFRFNNRVLLQLNMNRYVFDDQDTAVYKDILIKSILHISQNARIDFASSFPPDVKGILENETLVESLGLNPKSYNYTTSTILDKSLFGGYDFIVVNSFHTYLMLINKYQCPIYYLAYSKYYQQKALGLQNYGLLTNDKLITDIGKLTDLSSIRLHDQTPINRKDIVRSMSICERVLEQVEKNIL